MTETGTRERERPLLLFQERERKHIQVVRLAVLTALMHTSCREEGVGVNESGTMGRTQVRLTHLVTERVSRRLGQCCGCDPQEEKGEEEEKGGRRECGQQARRARHGWCKGGDLVGVVGWSAICGLEGRQGPAGEREGRGV